MGTTQNVTLEKLVKVEKSLRGIQGSAQTNIKKDDKSHRVKYTILGYHDSPRIVGFYLFTTFYRFFFSAKKHKTVMSTLFQNIAECVVPPSFLSANPWIVSLFLDFDTTLVQRQERRSLSSLFDVPPAE